MKKYLVGIAFILTIMPAVALAQTNGSDFYTPVVQQIIALLQARITELTNAQPSCPVASDQSAELKGQISGLDQQINQLQQSLLDEQHRYDGYGRTVTDYDQTMHNKFQLDTKYQINTLQNQADLLTQQLQLQ